MGETLAGMALAADPARASIAKPGNYEQTERVGPQEFVVRHEWGPVQRGLKLTTTNEGGGDTKRKRQSCASKDGSSSTTTR